MITLRGMAYPFDPLDDSALLAGLIEHDAQSWRRLVDKYSPLLLAVSRRTFASYGFRSTSEDVEDAVAEVWANLLAGNMRLVHQCMSRSNLLQTLQVLARNRSVDVMRKRRLNTVQLDEGFAAAEGEEDEADFDVDSHELAAAMDELTPRQRALVQLFFLQGRKYREIADLTGIPQNSVGPTLTRAVARLRQVLHVKQHA